MNRIEKIREAARDLDGIALGQNRLLAAALNVIADELQKARKMKTPLWNKILDGLIIAIVSAIFVYLLITWGWRP